MFKLFEFIKGREKGMDLATHTCFLQHLGDMLGVWKSSRHEFHMRQAALILSGKDVTQTLVEDTSGKKTREVLLRAAAHLMIAADKVVKEQEGRT